MNNFITRLFTLLSLLIVCQNSTFAQDSSNNAHTNRANREAEEATGQVVLAKEQLQNSFGADWRQLLLEKIPGLSTDFNFRGRGALTVFVDGLPAYQLESLTTAEIEEIRFLSGPEALAQYGAQSGVLLITTRQVTEAQGWHTGIHSGFTPYSNEQNDLLNGLKLTQHAYIDWSGTNNKVQLGYTNIIENSEETTNYQNQSLLNHRLSGHASGRINEQFAWKAGGWLAFDQDENNYLRKDVQPNYYNSNEDKSQKSGFLYGALFFQPTSRFRSSLRLNYYNVTEDHSSKTIHKGYVGSYEDTLTANLLRLNNTSYINSEIRLSYDIPVTSDLLLSTQFQSFISGKNISESKEQTERTDTLIYEYLRYRSDNQFNIRSLAFLEANYTRFLSFKGGLIFDSNGYTIDEKTNINPYLSLDVSLSPLLKESIISSIDLHSSWTNKSWSNLYGPISSAWDRDSSYHVGYERLESSIKLGLFKDRVNFGLNYFQQANKNFSTGIYSDTITIKQYPDTWDDLFIKEQGFEGFLQAQLVNNGALYWSASLQGRLMTHKLQFKGKQQNANLYYLPGEPLLPETNGTQALLNWQTGLTNTISWKGLELTAQLNMTNFVNGGNSPSFTRYYSFDPTYRIRKSYGGWPNEANKLERINLLTLQSLSIAYHLPQSMLKNTKIRGARIAFNTRNILLNHHNEIDLSAIRYNNYWNVNLNLHF